MDPAQAIRASTQDHLEIEDIKEGIVILKDGGACLVLNVSSINYDLLSEKEQEAIIYAYAALLNSLTFPIQIVIKTQPKDVSEYLNLLKQTAEKEIRRLIKEQILKYAKFVEEIVKKNNVLDKKFYIVIPMSPLEVSPVKNLTTKLSPSKRSLPFDKDYILKKAKINLYPKRDHILRLLRRLGIKGKQLDTQELIKLYFEIYNPESPGQIINEENQNQSSLVKSFIPAPPKNPPEKTPPAPPSQDINPPQEEGQSPAKEESLTKPASSVPGVDSVLEKINNLVKSPSLKNNQNSKNGA